MTEKYNLQIEEKQKQLEEMTEKSKQKQAELEKIVKGLEQEKKTLVPKEEVTKKLSRIFTPAQIKLVMNPTLKNVNWSDEDYALAMSARFYGTASYEYWRNVRKIPMPAPSSLRRKAGTLNFGPGILTTVFNHMKLKASTTELRDRLCALSFDEMYNSHQIDIDKKHEQVGSTRINLDMFHNEEEEDLLNAFENEAVKHNVSEEALQFVCGFVAYKYKDKHSWLRAHGQNLESEKFNGSCDWISFISRGKLSQPSVELLTIGRAMTKKFNEMHGEVFDRKPKVFQRLAAETIAAIGNNIEFPKEVLLCMARCMTWFRVRRFNQKLKEEVYVRQASKKIEKVTNKKVVTL